MILAKELYNNLYSGSETQVLRLTGQIRPEVPGLPGKQESVTCEYRRQSSWLL